jgi:hypothetical protein
LVARLAKAMRFCSRLTRGVMRERVRKWLLLVALLLPAVVSAQKAELVVVRKSESRLYLHISYPNAQDVASAKARGVKPGGQIMIHGQKNGLGWLSSVAQWFNWTDGCVGLGNKDMDAVWSAVDVGTPIQIYP